MSSSNLTLKLLGVLVENFATHSLVLTIIRNKAFENTWGKGESSESTRYQNVLI